MPSKTPRASPRTSAKARAKTGRAWARRQAKKHWKNTAGGSGQLRVQVPQINRKKGTPCSVARRQDNDEARKGAYGIEEGDTVETGVETARDLGISASVRLRKSGKSVLGKSVRTSQPTSRQGSWTSTHSPLWLSTSTPSQDAPFGTNSPRGIPGRHCAFQPQTQGPTQAITHEARVSCASKFKGLSVSVRGLAKNVMGKPLRISKATRCMRRTWWRATPCTCIRVGSDSHVRQSRSEADKRTAMRNLSCQHSVMRDHCMVPTTA